MKKKIELLILSLGIILLSYLCLGISTIQPSGTDQGRATVLYFRLGLALPFVSSVMLKQSKSVSLPKSGLMLGPLTKRITDRKIVFLPYPRRLHFLFSGGMELQDSIIQSVNSTYFDSRDRMITFFFIGHSNMAGCCAKMDFESMANVWLYTDRKGFYHGTDKNFSNNSGSPVIPFLKRMALLYPDYNFCGIKYAIHGMTIEDFLTKTDGNYIIDKINILKSKSIIGGVLLMFGFVEGKDVKMVQELDTKLKQLIDELREASGNKTLPFIFGRYEENNNKQVRYYNKYDDILVNKIQSLEKFDQYLKLTPIRPIPKQYYCDNHHYTSEGYQIWANDAAAIIQLNNFDFWKKDD
jgi:hypothetical protein